MTLRTALKSGTDDLHEELDALLGRYDLAQPDDYRAFLRIHARVLPPIEGALDEGGIADVLADWDRHRRAPLIAGDLAALGEEMPPPQPVPALNNRAQILGTAYVIEGSRLGSRFLAKRVGEAMPAEYLNAAGQQQAWPALLKALDRADFTPAETAEAIVAARACFGLFLGATADVPAHG